METGAALVLQKKTFVALSRVSPRDMVDPLKKLQARKYDTTQECLIFADEIAAYSPPSVLPAFKLGLVQRSDDKLFISMDCLNNVPFKFDFSVSDPEGKNLTGLPIGDCPTIFPTDEQRQFVSPLKLAETSAERLTLRFRYWATDRHYKKWAEVDFKPDDLTVLDTRSGDSR